MRLTLLSSVAIYFCPFFPPAIVALIQPALDGIRPISGGSLPRHLEPKVGHMDKRSKDGKRWDRRSFELERSQLHYYRKGQKYGDTIRLYGGIPITISPEDSRIIVIETDTRTWHFKADTPELAAEWLSALKLHSQVQGLSR